MNGDQLNEILQQGQIPVVCVKAAGVEILLLYNELMKFHTWQSSMFGFDGLGNQRDNALTMCQLAHLSALASKSRGGVDKTGDVCLWIDTLCVPVSGSGRKKAISMMAQICRDVDMVVAPDRDLQTSTSDVSAEELLV